MPALFSQMLKKKPWKLREKRRKKRKVSKNDFLSKHYTFSYQQEVGEGFLEDNFYPAKMTEWNKENPCFIFLKAENFPFFFNWLHLWNWYCGATLNLFCVLNWEKSLINWFLSLDYLGSTDLSLIWCFHILFWYNEISYVWFPRLFKFPIWCDFLPLNVPVCILTMKIC